MGKSLGFFEVPSTTAAISAVDIMLKTADVEFVTWEKKLGGRLVTVIIRGNVSAVTQAIESAAAGAVKKPAAYVVIANPHEEVVKLVNLSASRFESGGVKDGGEKNDSSEQDDSSKQDDTNNEK